MTLPTPILSAISSFDPTKPTSISFLYAGSQIEKKRIVITKSTDNSVVLDDTQYGMKLSYEMKENTLSSGQYIAQIQVFDFDGNTSELSQQVLFYCYTTPIISFTNFKSNISTSSVTLNLSYSQKENDPIKEYMFYLYDYQKTIISKSKTFYDVSNFSYTFFGLKNLTTYYVRCIAKSLHDIEADTGLLELNVKYIVNPNYTILELNNNKCEGYINVNCNIVDINYTTNLGKPTFSNGMVDLINKEVIYKPDEFSDNFSIFIKAKSVITDIDFFSFNVSAIHKYSGISDSPEVTGTVSLKIKKIAGSYYCVLSSITPSFNLDRDDYYYRYLKLDNDIVVNNSNILTDKNNNIIVFEIKYKYNLFSLNAYRIQNNQYIKI